MATHRAASSPQNKHSALIHLPVLVDESVKYLLTDSSGIYVDGTLGAGGHARALLQAMSPRGRLIGIDRDQRAVSNFEEFFRGRDRRITVFHSSFSRLKDLLDSQGISGVTGVLFDLGVASFQIDDTIRGFSYLQDGPLDMRMDTSGCKTAKQVVNRYPEQELAAIIRDYGQEHRWRIITRAIVRERERTVIDGTGRLAGIVRSVVPERQAVKSLARVFQAIRIEVNEELRELRQGLESALDALKPGGRLVVLCYQSLEDRTVKEVFALFSGICQCPRELPHCICDAHQVIRILTRRALRPSSQEVIQNPRARSARLRAAEKRTLALDDGEE